jgi:hypothetical protein
MAEGESEGPGGEPGGTACIREQEALGWTRVVEELGEFRLEQLDQEFCSGLALAPAARIWWPGVTRDSDPGDHPLVVALEVEVGLGERDPMTRKRGQASLEAMDV